MTMRFAPASGVTLAEPWLAGLVDDADLDVIRPLASAHPPVFDTVTFEIRLARGGGPVDFMVCATDSPGGRMAVAGTLDDWQGVDARTRAVLAAWAEPRSAVWRDIPILWLEYDIVDGQPRRPLTLPCLAGRSLASRLVATSPEHQCAILEAVEEAATGQALDRDSRFAFQRIATCLPRPVSVEHVFGLAARGSPNHRVVAYMAPEQASHWLDAIHWSGDVSSRRSLEALFSPRWCSVGVQIDIGPEPTGYLAFEVAFERDPWSVDAFAHLSEHLATHGACDTERARRALAWAGSERCAVDGVPHPVWVQRSVYFKVVARPLGALEVKAYLSLQMEPALLG